MKKNIKRKKLNIKDIINSLKNDKKLIISFICLLLFIILTFLIFFGISNDLDEYVSSYIIGIRSEKLTERMINITNIGGTYSLMVISLLLLIFIKKKKISLLVIINLITVFFTSQLFKFIFRRTRPDGIFLINESGFSYPSGHAMVSMAYILFIIYLLYNVLKNKLSKILITCFLSILILLIGFSRIYLGVHYFTDIIGGFLLGISYLMIFLHIIQDKEYIK